ncbi:MAG: AgmX/PglI C-terminal domain-containing protein [Pseudomonadota bacterium]
MYYRTYDLPWAGAALDDKRFRSILLWVAAVTLLFAIVVPVLPVRDPSTVAEPPPLPPRLARLIIERSKPVPPPPPPVVEKKPDEVKPVETPKPEPKPEPKLAEKPPVETPKPPPVEAPAPDRNRARERAQAAGVLALADELADLRSEVSVAQLDRKPTIASPGDAVRAERAMITTNAAASSGGINTASLSRNTGGAALAARESTRVESRVEAETRDAVEATRVSGDRATASRSREEIEMVFDRNKSAIFALYNRALRKDPGLEGKIVLTITIEPDGTVSACDVVSSDLDAPDLEKRLVRRVKLFRFEARDVATVTTTKPIDFFPA